MVLGPLTESRRPLNHCRAAEVHLSIVFILIASRIDQASVRHAQIHYQTWAYLKEIIANLLFGEEASIGAVEALLLLSEYQPGVLAGPGNHSKDFTEGNRTAWMLVGLAVRIGCTSDLHPVSSRWHSV